MSNLPIRPETALWIVLAAQVDDGDPQKVLSELTTLTNSYLTTSGHPAPAVAPAAITPEMTYTANLVALMEVTSRGIVTLRAQYRDMAKASDAAVTARLNAIQNLQSLGPLTGDSVWSKAISAFGGAGLLTALQGQAAVAVTGKAATAGPAAANTAAKGGLEIGGWAFVGIIVGMVTIQVLIWITGAALTAAANRQQANADQEIWREIVRQKLNAACLIFLDAAVREAKAVDPICRIDDPEAVLNEALALANPGICIAPDLTKKKTWSMDRKEGDTMVKQAMARTRGIAPNRPAGNP
jgi:hypothetical protein